LYTTAAPPGGYRREEEEEAAAVTRAQVEILESMRNSRKDAGYLVD